MRIALQNRLSARCFAEFGGGHFQLVLEQPTEKLDIVVAAGLGDFIHAFPRVDQQIAGMGQPDVLQIFAERNAQRLGEQ